MDEVDRDNPIVFTDIRLNGKLTLVAVSLSEKEENIAIHLKNQRMSVNSTSKYKLIHTMMKQLVNTIANKNSIILKVKPIG